jgi:mRNA interferase MazF
MKRGELWWADLAEPRGSEPGDRRPVLIVQDDHLTSSALSTVMVVPLTTNLRRAMAKGNVPLPKRDTSLPKDSVALVCQVLTLDKEFLDEPLRRLPPRLMQSVDAGLRLALSLG